MEYNLSVLADNTAHFDNISFFQIKVISPHSNAIIQNFRILVIAELIFEIIYPINNNILLLCLDLLLSFWSESI